jgi:hypothetical protein
MVEPKPVTTVEEPTTSVEETTPGMLPFENSGF